MSSPLLSPRGHPMLSFHTPCPDLPALQQPGGASGAAAMEGQLSSGAKEQGVKGLQFPLPHPPQGTWPSSFLSSGWGCSCPLWGPQEPEPLWNKQMHSTNPGKTKKSICFILGPGSSNVNLKKRCNRGGSRRGSVPTVPAPLGLGAERAVRRRLSQRPRAVEVRSA